MKQIITCICLLFSVAMMAQSTPTPSEARKINMSKTNAKSAMTQSQLGVVDGPVANSLRKGTLGVTVQPVEGGLQIKGFDNQNSSAKAAKMQAGDIITSINSKTISNEAELIKILSSYEAGDVVTIHYMRDHRKLSKDVRVGI